MNRTRISGLNHQQQKQGRRLQKELNGKSRRMFASVPIENGDQEHL
jgi:hypothetical protein